MKQNLIKAPAGAVRKINVTRAVAVFEERLADANDAAEALAIEREADSAETLMRNSGLYTPDEVRLVNELRMRARWLLGKLLAKIERGAGPGRGKKKEQAAPSFLDYLKEIKLEKARAIEAQRIAVMPKAELEKALAEVRKADTLASYAHLIRHARPWWFKASRQAKHKRINTAAAASDAAVPIGPFPLIYADPPWKFAIYSEKGLDRTPDQHYETMTDDEIMAFKIDGRSICEIAHRDAALLMWCTSSNLHRALAVMAAWGFEFKTSAVWDKCITGMGLVFRNQHELLLYGTRGKMPGPQYQPPSLFRYRRGAHSAKPPEIRAEIEKMYPDFDTSSRLELFAADAVIEGWTCYGKPHRQKMESGQAAE